MYIREIIVVRLYYAFGDCTEYLCAVATNSWIRTLFVRSKVFCYENRAFSDHGNVSEIRTTRGRNVQIYRSAVFVFTNSTHNSFSIVSPCRSIPSLSRSTVKGPRSFPTRGSGTRGVRFQSDRVTFTRSNVPGVERQLNADGR